MKMLLCNGRLSLGLFDAWPHAQAYDDAAKPVGGRWTIQKGGNRGMCRGGERSLSGYGNLRVRTPDMRGNPGDRRNGDTGPVPSCDAESRYGWVAMRARSGDFIR